MDCDRRVHVELLLGPIVNVTDTFNAHPIQSDWQHFFDTLVGYVEEEEATTKFNRTFLVTKKNLLKVYVVCNFITNLFNFFYCSGSSILHTFINIFNV